MPDLNKRCWSVNYPKVAVVLLLLSVPGKVWAQAPISCGETKSGNFTAPDQKDTYTFSGNAGEAVSIYARGTSGSVSAFAELFDSGGTRLAVGDIDSLVLPSTDTYTIDISEFGANHTGTYEVGLQFTTGRCSSSISCGQTLSGNFASRVQRDVYSFSGDGGEAVSIYARGTSGSVSAFAALYDSGGTRLTFGDIDSFALPATGTYYITLAENGLNHTGTYEVGLQFTTGRCSSSISCGQTLSGNFASRVQRDVYSFSGDGGEAVSIYARGTSGSVSAFAALYDSGGTRLTFGDIDSFALPATGTYYITLAENGLNHTGTYEVGLQFTTGRCSSSISCGQTLSGNFASRVQRDVYSFSGDGGEAVSIYARGTSGSVSAFAALYDSGGTRLTFGDIDSFALPATGTYYITLAENGLNHTGTYEVTLDFTNGCPGGPRNLTVQSTNPPNGVSITVSPADNNGDSDGTTQFTREYDEDTAVTLTAPSTASGNPFKEWLQNGQSFSMDTTVNVTMDVDYTMTAVYTPPRTLTVQSANPVSGVAITVSPADKNGDTDGTTRFTRQYDDGASVTLTAPTDANGNPFRRWLRNGQEFANNDTAAATVTMNADYTMTAVYGDVRTLTVQSSNPDSGVSITVSPADRNSNANGTTSFTREYDEDTSVTMTAPDSANGNPFKEWLRNGISVSTNATTTVTMDADLTMTAVYGSIHTLTVRSSNPDSGVSITVSPTDKGGNTGGTTEFARQYDDGMVVTLTAPSSVSGNTFGEWLRNGQSFSANTTTTVTMNANNTMTAVYNVPPPVVRLTVQSSNPDGGVSIGVGPSDTDGRAGGSTTFTRRYVAGTEVTLVAPDTAGGNPFVKWLRNGLDFSTSPSVTVQLDADTAMLAVYEGCPEILRMQPGTMAAGGPEFKLLVLGRDFVPGAAVLWGGEKRPTTILNSRLLRATISETDIAIPSGVQVAVENPGGQICNSLTFTVTSVPPFLCCTNPTSANVGDGDRTITVFGNNFIPDSAFRWNGSPRPTRVVNGTLLEVTIPGADFASPGAAAVSVQNPDGSSSDSVTIEIVELAQGAPEITRITPDQFPVGRGGFALTVFGTGFVSGSNIEFNDEDKPTDFVSNTELRCQIQDEDIAGASTYRVRVVNPDSSAPGDGGPFGITGNEAVVVVFNPVPEVGAFTPTSVMAGNSDVLLQVRGSGFTSGTVLRWNGTDLETVVMSDSELQVILPDAELESVDTAVFSVSNPGPGGGSSHAQTYSITTDTPAEATLYYPRLLSRRNDSESSDNSESTGIAVVNLGGEDAQLTVRALEGEGSETTGAEMTNPVSMTLNPGEQNPIVDSQLFGSGISDSESIRWMKIESTQAKTAGFFLSFNDTLGVLDGADVSSATLSSFVLPEILVPEVQTEGNTKEANEDGFTQIHVANPNPDAATVTFELYGSDGTLREAVSRRIEPNGTLVVTVSDLFEDSTPAASDYIVATSDQPVVPFELLGKTGVFVHGLNGQDGTASNTVLYSPQYVVGGETWRSTLTVVNLTGTAGNVQFEFIGDDGTQIGTVRTLPIAANGKIYITDQRFFVDAGGVLTQGYVKVTSDGPSLSGSVVFGDQGLGQFSAALPLVSQLLDSMIFGQVASDAVYFTGAAILNPNEVAVTATIDVFDKEGNLVVTVTRVIPAGRRTSLLLTQYFPELEDRTISSGYIRITVDQGVASFALFGTNNLSVLSAVPPQVVP